MVIEKNMERRRRKQNIGSGGAALRGAIGAGL